MEIKKYFRIKYYREILNLKYQFFRKQSLLNLKSEISISKKTTKLNKNTINQIYNLLNKQDKINKDSMWFAILNNYHVNFLKFVKQDKKN